MYLARDPYKQAFAASASRRQDALILNAIQRRNVDANRAQQTTTAESVRLMRAGIARREYYNFVSGLSEYLTL